MKSNQPSRLLQGLLSSAAVLSVTGGMVGVSTDANAGISNTKHNLTAAGNTNRVTAGAGTEICVFCHTPHGADTSAPVPLWNKNLATGATYTTYAALGSSSLDGEVLAVGSISLACLSCHDGAQAMDNIINSPGSGGYNTTGGGATGQAFTWNTTGNVNAAGQLVSTINGTTNLAVTLIGADLRNDHPIGIEYCGGFSAANTTSCKDADFNPAVLIGTFGTSTAKYYVEASGNTSKDKSDMILYTRTFAAGVGRPSVECASCHDPHAETKAATEVAFLRKSQAASGLCLACHNK